MKINCIYPQCLMTECLHGVNGEPHCQRRSPKIKPDYKKIISIIVLLVLWGFIFYIYSKL